MSAPNDHSSLLAEGTERSQTPSINEHDASAHTALLSRRRRLVLSAVGVVAAATIAGVFAAVALESASGASSSLGEPFTLDQLVSGDWSPRSTRVSWVGSGGDGGKKSLTCVLKKSSKLVEGSTCWRVRGDVPAMADTTACVCSLTLTLTHTHTLSLHARTHTHTLSRAH